MQHYVLDIYRLDVYIRHVSPHAYSMACGWSWSKISLRNQILCHRAILIVIRCTETWVFMIFVLRFVGVVRRWFVAFVEDGGILILWRRILFKKWVVWCSLQTFPYTYTMYLEKRLRTILVSQVLQIWYISVVVLSARDICTIENLSDNLGVFLEDLMKPWIFMCFLSSVGLRENCYVTKPGSCFS